MNPPTRPPRLRRSDGPDDGGGLRVHARHAVLSCLSCLSHLLGTAASCLRNARPGPETAYRPPRIAQCVPRLGRLLWSSSGIGPLEILERPWRGRVFFRLPLPQLLIAPASPSEASSQMALTPSMAIAPGSGTAAVSPETGDATGKDACTAGLEACSATPLSTLLTAELRQRY